MYAAGDLKTHLNITLPLLIPRDPEVVFKTYSAPYSDEKFIQPQHLHVWRLCFASLMHPSMYDEHVFTGVRISSDAFVVYFVYPIFGIGSTCFVYVVVSMQLNRS